MKVAQVVGVWVLALAVGVIAATLVWTTWLEALPAPEPQSVPEPLSDAERVWCSNNLVWVMLAAEPLGIPMPDAVPERVRNELGWLRFHFYDFADFAVQVFEVEGGFFSWAGRTSGEDRSVFFPRVWATAPFDRLCRAAFEGR